MSKLATVNCKNCDLPPHIREPIIFPEKHPMHRVVISKARISCKCGWKSAEFPDLTAAILNWNKIMS